LIACTWIPTLRAENYVIPEARDFETIEGVVHSAIPEKLREATCGYPSSVKAIDAITKVDGVPLRPRQWPPDSGLGTAGPNDDDTQDVNPGKAHYPSKATGYSFAYYKDDDGQDPDPYCQPYRENKDGAYYDPIPCKDGADCKATCDAINQKIYPVDRASRCKKDITAGWEEDQGQWVDMGQNVWIENWVDNGWFDGDGFWIENWEDWGWWEWQPNMVWQPNPVWHDTSRTITKEMCNATPEECAAWNLNGVIPNDAVHQANPQEELIAEGPGLVDETSYVYAGDKYFCTAKWQERTAQKTPNGNVPLMVPYGWVWGGPGAPNVIMPAQDDDGNDCRAKWIAEPKEYPNCKECGVPPNSNLQGEQCRSYDGRPYLEPPVDDDGNPFNPVANADVERPEAPYESFYRTYEASHVLGKFPEIVDHEDEAKVVKVNCYDWYDEERGPEDGNCVMDKLDIIDLRRRELEGDPEFNKEDETDAEKGGFSLNQQKKVRSEFNAAPLTEGQYRPAFGETNKIVQVMTDLEKRMEGFPPTVDLILPLTRPIDELTPILYAAIGKSSNSSVDEYGYEYGYSQSSVGRVSIVEVSVPLQRGLLEEVRTVLLRSLTYRLREKSVPVVIPQVSQLDLQAIIQSWESWKKQRKYLEDAKWELPDADGDVDELLAKLKEYKGQVEAYRGMRAELPNYASSLFTYQNELAKKIEEWVDNRMQPYNDVLAIRDQQDMLMNSWKNLKEQMAKLSWLNTPYCKNDMTTPPLVWLEEEYFEPPEIPPYPKHLVFDFSNIFYTDLANLPVIEVPVFLPVQVALDLPSAPDATLKTTIPKLPNLPDVPELPDPKSFLTVELDDTPDPSNQSFSPGLIMSGFEQLASQFRAMQKKYFYLYYKEEENPERRCENPGEKDCVWSEPFLWQVFMRIWAPLGAFFTPDLLVEQAFIPAQNAFSSVARAYSSSSSSSSACPPGDVSCALEEEVVKRGLQVTFPQNGQTSGIQQLRDTMRGATIDDEGKLVGSQSSQQQRYDIQKTQDLYDSYVAQPDIRLEVGNSSSSLNSSTYP